MHSFYSSPDRKGHSHACQGRVEDKKVIRESITGPLKRSS
jgi:hypothetical protein